MKLKINSKIQEILEEIVKSNKLKSPTECFVLYLPPQDVNLNNALWFDETKFLKYYPVVEKVICFMFFAWVVNNIV
jgi:hypothetical protein